MLKINGVAVAAPKVFQVDIADIDGETHRNLKGNLVRDRLATKRKLNCEWAALTMTEISTLLQAVDDVFFSVEYPDPYMGTSTTKTFYVGDRQMPLYSYVDGQILWEGLKMNFIER